jgi:hypothetical protein
VVLRVCSEPRRVTVAFHPYAGDQARFEERDHRRRRLRRDVDVQQLALPMHAVIIALVDSRHNHNAAVAGPVIEPPKFILSGTDLRSTTASAIMTH